MIVHVKNRLSSGRRKRRDINMDINMEDLLPSGVHGEYKFCAIRLQLKYGEVEIGPPQRHRAGEDDAASVVLQVYNEFAHEVEIEYQPATKREDTQWRFVCDGRILKTIVPHKFWKRYLYPNEEHRPSRPEDVDPKSKSSNPSASACVTGTTFLESNPHLVAEQRQGFQAPPGSPLLGAHRRNRQVSEQQDARPALKVLQSNQRAHTHQRTVDYTSYTGFGERKLSEAAKKNKPANTTKDEKVANTTMNRGFTEKQFKVQCTRPAPPWNLAQDVVYLPVETYERVIRVKCYRPDSSERRLQELTSSNKPYSTPEELFKAKLGLQSDKLSSLDRKRYTGLMPLRQVYAREITDGVAATPYSEAEVASCRKSARCASSAQTTIDTATSPMPTAREDGASLSAQDASIAHIHDKLPGKGSLLGYGQQCNILTVGKVLLKDEHSVWPFNLWRTNSEQMYATTADLSTQGRSSGYVLKCVLELIVKETQILLKRRKKHLVNKRRWYRPKVKNVWCACLEPKCREVDETDFVASRHASVKSVLRPTRMRLWTCRSRKAAD